MTEANKDTASALMRFKKITLEAERDLAFDSIDYQVSRGSRNDSNSNWRFNQKLYALYPLQMLTILDIGCGGGAFVRTCIDDGQIAVGIEGNDFSKRVGRRDWRSIPDFLFTCDATHPFQFKIHLDGVQQDLQFDVVTSWEFIEHIADDDISKVAENVKRHLKQGGLWILSANTGNDFRCGHNFHLAVHDEPWWRRAFEDLGFTVLPEVVAYFNDQFVRGPKNTPNSFVLALTLHPDHVPQTHPAPWTTRLMDRWLDSKWQRRIKNVVLGYS
ncbi:MAG: class I SAM-dependent methyltransferase [Verrucomicrobia bacterium]|nr:class I SAM-dependent methyltransferase [Verrucomicrobiota bacterium]